MKNNNTMNTIPERYFIYDLYAEDSVLDLMEVDKDTFDRTSGEVTTERHTMFNNGVNQVCHTKDNL